MLKGSLVRQMLLNYGKRHNISTARLHPRERNYWLERADLFRDLNTITISAVNMSLHE